MLVIELLLARALLESLAVALLRMIAEAISTSDTTVTANLTSLVAQITILEQLGGVEKFEYCLFLAVGRRLTSACSKHTVLTDLRRSMCCPELTHRYDGRQSVDLCLGYALCFILSKLGVLQAEVVCKV